jgi:HTH-type transcriptional regulator/antitoxin HigA
MKICPINSDERHDQALREIERLWGAEPGTEEGDRLDILLTLVDAYEAKRWPIDAPDPVEAIRQHMELTGRTQRDLARLLGSPSRASEILRRKRALTIDMVHKLSSQWRIPAEELVKPYPLEAA